MPSERFSRAVEYARIAHAGQIRTGTDTPYLAHVLSVAALVLEHGGSEDQAVAGLLHDVVEDCGLAHADAIEREFGPLVRAIVMACTDGTAEEKDNAPDARGYGEWLRRKQAYLRHLEGAPDDALMVSGCDKLHNVRSIVGDLRDPAVGASVFGRFTGEVDGTLAYYEAVWRLLDRRQPGRWRDLEHEVTEMHRLIGRERRPLES